MAHSVPSECVVHAAAAASLKPKKQNVILENSSIYAYIHLSTAYALYLIATGKVNSLTFTILWSVFLYVIGMLGVTAGAHRLWSHRAYKATWQLRSLLMLMQTVAFQMDIYTWARDHRAHHRFTDTDADPHNSKRGFVFSHIGWLMMWKHPDVKIKAASIDLSDLQGDPVVMFQRRYYFSVLIPLVALAMPTVVPVLVWGESGWAAWHVCTVARFCACLHSTLCINSFAHMWGMHPIDKSITPSNNPLVSHLTLGEGWHNFHHVFPWDYRAGEFGGINGNAAAVFIDLFRRIGWAFDLKTVSQEMIDRRMQRTGDGSHPRANLKIGKTWDYAHTDISENVVRAWNEKDVPK